MRKLHTSEPKLGDFKWVTRFLFFPKRIGNETRWLEIATWEEVFTELAGLECMYNGWQERNWVS